MQTEERIDERKPDRIDEYSERKQSSGTEIRSGNETAHDEHLNAGRGIQPVFLDVRLRFDDNGNDADRHAQHGSSGQHRLRRRRTDGSKGLYDNPGHGNDDVRISYKERNQVFGRRAAHDKRRLVQSLHVSRPGVYRLVDDIFYGYSRAKELSSTAGGSRRRRSLRAAVRG